MPVNPEPEPAPPLSKGLDGDEEMIAQYWDETEDVLAKEIVSDWPAFLELVRRTETSSSGRRIPAIELFDDEDVTCIFIRFEGGGCTVATGDSKGLAWPAGFNNGGCEYVQARIMRDLCDWGDSNTAFLFGTCPIG